MAAPPVCPFSGGMVCTCDGLDNATALCRPLNSWAFELPNRVVMQPVNSLSIVYLQKFDLQIKQRRWWTFFVIASISWVPDRSSGKCTLKYLKLHCLHCHPDDEDRFTDPGLSSHEVNNQLLSLANVQSKSVVVAPSIYLSPEFWFIITWHSSNNGDVVCEFNNGVGTVSG